MGKEKVDIVTRSTEATEGTRAAFVLAATYTSLHLLSIIDAPRASKSGQTLDTTRTHLFSCHATAEYTQF